MATDIVDKELKALRNARWEKAFSETHRDENERDTINRKATIVIEHLIQASDVAHTMQVRLVLILLKGQLVCSAQSLNFFRSLSYSIGTSTANGTNASSRKCTTLTKMDAGTRTLVRDGIRVKFGSLIIICEFWSGLFPLDTKTFSVVF